MSDQDTSVVAATPEAEINEAPNEERLLARRTTAAEQESAQWLQERNQDVVANRALKEVLGHGYEAYRGQLETMTSDERLNLLDKSPEEITAHLDEKAAAERNQKKREEESEKEARERQDASFAETPQLREVRKAMKTAFEKAASLDERIAELQRFNELRQDPTDPGWDDVDSETWRLAREGKMESFDGEIVALTQQRQAALQEAGLHQSAYHEGMRAVPPPPQNQPAPDKPIGQIPGADGKPVQLTRDDIASLAQLEIDHRSHMQRLLESKARYPDWGKVISQAIATGIDIGPRENAFIASLPNSADVVYYLLNHHDERKALQQMPTPAATRALFNISHKVIRPTATAEPKKTSAPKPPSPVGGGSARVFDVNDEGGSADEWFHRRNADLKRRGKL